MDYRIVYQICNREITFSFQFFLDLLDAEIFPCFLA